MKIKNLVLSIFALSLCSCALPQLKKGESVTAKSIDVLRKNEAMSINAASENTIAVKVQAADGSACLGSFTYADGESQKGYLGITQPANVYYGSFKAGQGPACLDATGNDGVETALVHMRVNGLLSSSMMAREGVKLCQKKEGLCLPHNTFMISDR